MLSRKPIQRWPAIMTRDGGRRLPADLRLLLGEGVDEDEAGASGGVGGVELNLAVEDFGYHTADGETETGALLKGIKLGEALEDGFGLIGWDAGTRIGDGEGDVAGILG